MIKTPPTRVSGEGGEVCMVVVPEWHYLKNQKKLVSYFKKKHEEMTKSTHRGPEQWFTVVRACLMGVLLFSSLLVVGVMGVVIVVSK